MRKLSLPGKHGAERRRVLAAAALMLGGLLALHLGVIGVAHPLIDAAYRDAAVGPLNSRIGPHQLNADGTPKTPADYYGRLAQLEARAALAIVFAGTALMLLAGRRYVAGFFRRPSHAADLAVFRIVVFGVMLWLLDREKVLINAARPASSREPFFLTGWLFELLPAGAGVVEVAYWVTLVAAALAMIGLFARPAAAVAAVSFLYVEGTVFMFGKVDHAGMPVVWFAALLAASRCSDAWSIDAVWKAWRRADRGDVAPPAPSAAYGGPLRRAMVLLGLAYFFPGFWKVGIGGTDWFFGDALRYTAQKRWFIGAGVEVPMPTGSFAFLTKLAGLTAVLWESTFVYAIFFRRPRAVYAAMGMGFHEVNRWVLGISFTVMQWMYVIFVPWGRLFAWLGGRLYTEPMAVAYDGNCKLCRRSIATVNAFDVFGRVRFINAMDDAAVRGAGLGDVDPMELYRDMQAVVGGERWAGYYAWRALARRSPVLWPVLPLMYLPPVARAGEAVYRRVADARTCKPPVKAEAGDGHKAAAVSTPRRPGMLAPTVVAVVIAIGCLFTGALAKEVSWPIACFPHFGHAGDSTWGWLRVEVERADGEVETLDHLDIARLWRGSAFTAAMARVTGADDAEEARRLFEPFWALWQQHDPTLADARRVEVQAVVYDFRGF